MHYGSGRMQAHIKIYDEKKIRLAAFFSLFFPSLSLFCFFFLSLILSFVYSLIHSLLYFREYQADT